jgi:hypothetical protein
MPNFHFENFLMVRAGFAVNAIFDRRSSSLLQPFLESGFMVGPFQTGVCAERRGQQRPLQKGRGCRQTGVEINRAEDGLEDVGQQTTLIAASRFFFAGTEPQMSAEREALGGGVERSGTNQPRQALGKLARIPIRKSLTKRFADDQPENTIAQKFEPFVIDTFGELAIRTVGDRSLEQFGRSEMVADNGLQIAALIVIQRTRMSRIGQFAVPRLLLRSWVGRGLLFRVIGLLFAASLQAARNCGALGEGVGSVRIFVDLVE